MLATLMGLAVAYGPAAVSYVTANAWWLVPLGGEAILLIKKIFG
ncbi:hypothetical protein [Tuanshanicoccus yangjingiae]